MKSIETGFGSADSLKFHEAFCEWAEDLFILGESRGIKVNETHIYGLLCKIIDMINDRKVVHLQNTGYKAPFVKVTFEETSNKSAKFTVILLDDNKNPLGKKKSYPTLYFLASDQDIKNNTHKFKEIFSLPNELPPAN